MGGLTRSRVQDELRRADAVDMKLNALLVAMLAAGIATSLAVASPPADRGREGRTGTDMTATTKTKPERGPKRDREGKRDRIVTFMLKGRFVSASGNSFAMLVKHANRHGRSLRGKQLTLLVDDKTKFRRQGPAELGDLAGGDRLLVLVRARKTEGANALELLARFVHAKPAKREREGERKPGTTTTGTTTSAD